MLSHPCRDREGNNGNSHLFHQGTGRCQVLFPEEPDGVRYFFQRGPMLLRPFRGIAVHFQVVVSAGSFSRISSNISEYISACDSSVAHVSPGDRRTCHHLPDIGPARPPAGAKTSYPQTHLPLRRQGSSPISTDFQKREKGESKRRRFRGESLPLASPRDP